MLYVYNFIVTVKKYLHVLALDYIAVAVSGKVGPVKPVNHTSWVAVVTPTDRPKSVRNRCVIELFCDVVYVVILPFWQFCWCRGFCHRTESDLFLFLLEFKSTFSVVNFKTLLIIVKAIERINKRPHTRGLGRIARGTKGEMQTRIIILNMY